MDIKIPTVGESITEATISEWFKKDGDFVEQNEVLLSLETDKASVEVVAEKSGLLKILTGANETVQIGAVVGSLDTDAKAPAASEKQSEKPASSQPESQTAKPAETSSAVASNSSDRKSPMADHLSPATRRVVEERGLNSEDIKGTGPSGRITKNDAVTFTPAAKAAPSTSTPAASKPVAAQAPTRAFSGRGSRREKMTTIRKRIAERLVQAQQDAAILTTFNEVDMTAVMNLRSQYKDVFEKKHGVRLGFMGFFVKAVVAALKDFQAVNAFIEGDELIYNDFVNMGIAVGGPKGLVVPVIKDADLLSIAEIELEVKRYAEKAQSNKLTIGDLTGGTFTISNGGVYGSLMSTPILNPPQSGILGMHKIQDRPVAINGKVEIRPMMYLALSYDHRVIDGKQSVSFLVKIKDALEDPSRLVLEV
jgi:2-oxoglutarate dehydrogenase E2 component (dihydrolipoamide succinyltransferase)